MKKNINLNRTNPKTNFKEEVNDLALLGRGKGFLGLSKKYNKHLFYSSSILFFIGVLYFALIKQYFSSLALFGLYLVIQLEIHREK